METNKKLLTPVKIISFMTIINIIAFCLETSSLFTRDYSLTAKTQSSLYYGLAISGYSLSAIATIIGIIALSITRKINGTFKAAFIDCITSFVFTVVAIILLCLPTIPALLLSIICICAIFFEISVFFLYMFALSAVHIDNDDDGLVSFGKFVMWSYLGIILGVLICRIVAAANKNSAVVVYIFGILAIILALCGYFIFLSFNKKSYKSIKACVENKNKPFEEIDTEDKKEEVASNN